MLDLKALESVLAPLEALGKEELTFDAGGTEVTLCYMPPESETEAQRWASEILPKTKDGDDMDTFAVAEYLDRFKVAVLSHTLIRVGGQELGDFIETGEVLDNGVAVKVPRHKALRQLLPKWGRPVLAAMFRKYAELMDKLDQKADKAIHFEASDLDAEIERLEQRLTDLKRDRTRRLAKDDHAFSGQVKLAADFEGDRKAEVQADLEKMRDIVRTQDEAKTTPEEVPAPVAPERPRERQPIIPSGVAPITTPVAPRVQPTPRVEVQPVAPPEPMDTSFIDPADASSAQSVIAAENARMMAERQAARTFIQDTPPAATRRPPHADARDVEAEVGAVGAGARLQAEEAGLVDGIPAYRLPTQSLETREQVQGGTAVVDKGATGSLNPRFRSSNQGG